jgi:hypothetical protein
MRNIEETIIIDAETQSRGEKPLTFPAPPQLRVE